MPYTTVVAGTAITASWGNASVRDQVVTPFASSAARTSAITSPVEGMLSALTDTDSLDYFNGSGWVTVGSAAAWLTWSPSYTNLTIGNGTVSARYQHIGKTVHFRWKLVLGSTSSVGAGPLFTLPVTPHTSWSQFDPIGIVGLQDTGTGSRIGALLHEAGSSAGLYSIVPATGLVAALTATSPHTWAQNDVITVHGTYEAN